MYRMLVLLDKILLICFTLRLRHNITDLLVTSIALFLQVIKCTYAKCTMKIPARRPSTCYRCLSELRQMPDRGGICVCFSMCMLLFTFFQERDYILCNYVPDSSKCPPLIPSGRYKIEMTATCDSIELWTVYVTYGISNSLMQITYQVYKFASNEYRLFPLRFQTLMCDLYNKDIIGLGSFTKCRNYKGCPHEKVLQTIIFIHPTYKAFYLLQERNYTICNFTPDTTRLPPLIPNGRYKVVLEGSYGSLELWSQYLLIEITRPIV